MNIHELVSSKGKMGAGIKLWRKSAASGPSSEINVLPLRTTWLSFGASVEYCRRGVLDHFNGRDRLCGHCCELWNCGPARASHRRQIDDIVDLDPTLEAMVLLYCDVESFGVMPNDEGPLWGRHHVLVGSGKARPNSHFPLLISNLCKKSQFAFEDRTFTVQKAGR